MKVMKMVWQVCFFYILFLIGNVLSSTLHVPIPGSIFGLFLLFGLLALKIVKVEWVDLGAAWLLSELLLFFVPSAVGIIQYKEIMGLQGIKIVLVILVSTLFVMTFTGISAEILSKFRRGGKRGTPSANR
ncbi:CidA/LrgA family protein [Heyndrickxia acidicola]|uniref:CidA/LrgA family holin-like protein n=1 Tax=Heyndrickxia acidicola TaxID=209389 RepID=A0ABU6MKU8_9BACI|nr:CidA/LrgA family holin-like protein [Heyndrickxia acidicola]MED1203670.1 CidA/LrgA family holin-like protein [Heyndrickxia acidicola]